MSVVCCQVLKAATCIAKRAVETDIVPGRSPISVTAAAIYMASQVRGIAGWLHLRLVEPKIRGIAGA